jgi:hypothetical protein
VLEVRYRMHLLEIKPDGGFSLTKDHNENENLKYAILSHTWGDDGDEVTFEDLNQGIGTQKKGYRKIESCARQASRDGYRYLWVDTCCINKSNAVEFQYTINSMFRFYQKAAKCYVYLSDFKDSSVDDSSQPSQAAFEASFRKCRWFTRGWTLQELIAPKSVAFFSEDWKLLGSKESLERQIGEITSIPVQALQGKSLDSFTVTERISWSERRQTKYEEDMVYSLLGIFGVYVPLNYGEGKEYAFQRLHDEIQRVQKGMLLGFLYLRERISKICQGTDHNRSQLF